MTTQRTLDGNDQTKLVNMRSYDRSEVTPIDRSTKFGNPFRLKSDGGEYTREESIEKYESWFYQKITSDDEFRQSVHELQGETLGCWCTPKPCHGDVIVEYIRSL